MRSAESALTVLQADCYLIQLTTQTGSSNHEKDEKLSRTWDHSPGLFGENHKIRLDP